MTTTITSPATSTRALELDRILQTDAIYGWRIENRTPTQATIAKGKPVHHLLHFLIGFLTIGLWWICVWLPLTIVGGVKRQLVTIDTHGNISRQKIK